MNPEARNYLLWSLRHERMCCVGTRLCQFGRLGPAMCQNDPAVLEADLCRWRLPRRGRAQGGVHSNRRSCCEAYAGEMTFLIALKFGKSVISRWCESEYAAKEKNAPAVAHPSPARSSRAELGLLGGTAGVLPAGAGASAELSSLNRF